MKIESLILASSLLAIPAFVSAGEDCPDKAAKAQAKQAKLLELDIEAVSGLVTGGKAQVVDANSDETRAKMGVVPGARLLTNYKSYDVAKELPAAKDSKLIFYCGGTSCRAADGAAVKAKGAGYKDVAVMRAGISGWKKAGKPVTPFKPAT